MTSTLRPPRTRRAWRFAIATAATAALAAMVAVTSTAGAYVTQNSTVDANELRSATVTDLGVYGLSLDPAEGTVLRPGDEASLYFRSHPNPNERIYMAIEPGDTFSWTITVPEQLEIVDYAGGTVSAAHNNVWTQDQNTLVNTYTYTKAVAWSGNGRFDVTVRAIAEIPASADVSVEITLPDRFVSRYSQESIEVPSPDDATTGVHNLTFTPDGGALALRPEHGVTRGVLSFRTSADPEHPEALNLNAGDVAKVQVGIRRDLVGDFDFPWDTGHSVRTLSDDRVGDFHVYTITETFTKDVAAWDWSFEMGLTTAGVGGSGASVDGDPISVEVTLPDRFELAHPHDEVFVPFVGWGVVPFTQVSTGGEHALALAEDGTLFAWGRNTEGQLGTGDTVSVSVPTPVQAPEGVRFTSVEAAFNGSVALAEDGTVYTWGLQYGIESSQVPTPLLVPGDPVIESFDFADLGLAVADTGDVFAWGYNSNGAAGVGTSTTNIKPTRVDLPQRATTVVSTRTRSWFLLEDGRTMVAGLATNGVLGVPGVSSTETIPIEMPTPDGDPFVDLAANAAQAQALTLSGKHYRWGRSVGDTPTVQPDDFLGTGIRPVKLVRGASSSYGAAVGSDGGLYTWTNYAGPAKVLAPAQLFVVDASEAFGSGGNFYAVALSPHGLAFAAVDGANAHGQLGNGSVQHQYTRMLTPVVMPTGSFAAAAREAQRELAADVDPTTPPGLLNEATDDPLVGPGDGDSDLTAPGDGGTERPGEDSKAPDAPDNDPEKGDPDPTAPGDGETEQPEEDSGAPDAPNDDPAETPAVRLGRAVAEAAASLP